MRALAYDQHEDLIRRMAASRRARPPSRPSPRVGIGRREAACMTQGKLMPLERMGAFRLACAAIVASVAVSCSAERAQQEPERKEIDRQLTAAYYSCVRTSFASMLPT